MKSQIKSKPAATRPKEQEAHLRSEAVFAQSKSPVGKADRTRLKCIDAAIAILSSQGMDKFTYENIAVTAGLSRQLVKNYYNEKHDLVLQAALLVRKSYQGYVIRRIKGQKSPEDVFNSYVKAALRWATDAKLEARFWIIYYHYCAVLNPFKDANTDLVNLGKGRIQAILRSIDHLADLSESEVASRARMVQVLITGAIVSLTTETLPHNKRLFEQSVLESCQQLAGLASLPSQDKGS